MKGTKFITIYIMVVCLILTLMLSISLVATKISKEKIELTPEQLRVMEYEELTDESVEGTEYVKFGAFFTEDRDGDGYAEKILGSCKEIGETSTLYLDLSVVDNGYLKDGKITITNQNFTNSMSILKDSMLKQNYISDNVRTIEFNNINAGSNEFLSGIISASIANENDYSKTVYVTLTGTHVSDPDPDNNNEVTETPINKTIELTIKSKEDGSNLENCRFKLYENPLIRWDNFISLFESYIESATK